MTPDQIRRRRIELGLSTTELASVLEITETELQRIEAGNTLLYHPRAFEEAFEILEECLEATFAGA